MAPSFFELCYAFHKEYIYSLLLEKRICNRNGMEWNKTAKYVESCRILSKIDYVKRKICKKIKKF